MRLFRVTLSRLALSVWAVSALASVPAARAADGRFAGAQVNSRYPLAVLNHGNSNAEGIAVEREL